MRAMIWSVILAGVLAMSAAQSANAQYACWANDSCGVSDCQHGCGAIYLEPDGPCDAGCTNADGIIPNFGAPTKGKTGTYCFKGKVESSVRNVRGVSKCAK
jgi:hypothetical protein